MHIGHTRRVPAAEAAATLSLACEATTAEMSLSSTDDFEVDTCESIETEDAEGERRSGLWLKRGPLLSLMGGDGVLASVGVLRPMMRADRDVAIVYEGEEVYASVAERRLSPATGFLQIHTLLVECRCEIRLLVHVLLRLGGA